MARLVLTVSGMPAENATVAVYRTTADAVTAVAELRRQGVAPASISTVAADEQSGSRPVVYYLDGEKNLRGTAAADDWSVLWQTLEGCAVLLHPGMPAILLAGPFAACAVRALNNESLFGDLGPIAGALYSLGFTRETALKYEATALAGCPLVMVHGRSREVARARQMLAGGALTLPRR